MDDLELPLTIAQVEQILRRLGPHITFERGSNPHIHVHVTQGPVVSTKQNIVGQAGAASFGAGAATNHGDLSAHVVVGPESAVTHEDFRGALGDVRRALADDFERLETHTYDALHQFLRQASDLQVHGAKLCEVHKMLEDLWVKDAAEACKKSASFDASKVARVIHASGILGVLAKQLVPSAPL